MRAAVLALPLAGCGHDEVVDPTGPAREVTIIVDTHLRPGPHGELFHEGALPEIRLVNDARTLTPVRDHRDRAEFRDVPPGEYRLPGALRPCDGNCGSLDGATSRCAQQVHVRQSATFDVSWRVGSPCRVSPR